MNNTSKPTSSNKSTTKKVYVNSFRVDFTPISKHSNSTVRNPGFTATMKPIIKKHKSATASIGGRKKHNTTRRLDKGATTKKKHVRFSNRNHTIKK